MKPAKHAAESIDKHNHLSVHADLLSPVFSERRGMEGGKRRAQSALFHGSIKPAQRVCRTAGCAACSEAARKEGLISPNASPHTELGIEAHFVHINMIDTLNYPH